MRATRHLLVAASLAIAIPVLAASSAGPVTFTGCSDHFTWFDVEPGTVAPLLPEGYAYSTQFSTVPTKASGWVIAFRCDAAAGPGLSTSGSRDLWIGVFVTPPDGHRAPTANFHALPIATITTDAGLAATYDAWGAPGVAEGAVSVTETLGAFREGLATASDGARDVRAETLELEPPVGYRAGFFRAPLVEDGEVVAFLDWSWTNAPRHSLLGVSEQTFDGFGGAFPPPHAIGQATHDWGAGYGYTFTRTPAPASGGGGGIGVSVES